MPDMTQSGDKERQERLKEIVRALHEGVPVEKLRKRFAELIRSTSPEEIAAMENALIQEGFPVSEVQRLCDVHVQVFEDSLKRRGRGGRIPGHPIHTYIEENREAKRMLKRLKRGMKRVRRPGEDAVKTFREEFERFKAIEIHYRRKENQLFPALEAKGFTGPTQVMWGKHDEIRGHIKTAARLLGEGDWPGLSRQMGALSSAVRKLIFLEEKILFPTAARKLGERDWAEIKRGEPEIGYAWVRPGNLWDARIARMKGEDHPPEEEIMSKETHGDQVALDEGSLNGEQLRLLLKHLPVDITFVDENDEVRFYSASADRIFPRSPAVIGRKVQNCHPPKSVHVVNDILKAFREKKKEVAEFWIQMQGKFIHIRYFPVYDGEGRYRGVIEVSQDATPIRALEGERRLLDW